MFNSSIPGCHYPPQLEGFALKSRAGRLVGRLPCDPSWESDVVEQYRPKIVFWIVGNASDGRGTYHGERVRPCTEPYDSLYAQRLTTEIAILGAKGARVVIPTEAYDRADGVARFDRSTDCVNHIRRTVAAAAGAQLVELGAYVCPEHRCPPEINGVTLRPDGLHYEHRGAQLVAGWLLRQVGEREKGSASADLSVIRAP